jgi:hypothetical protein
VATLIIDDEDGVGEVIDEKFLFGSLTKSMQKKRQGVGEGGNTCIQI